MTKSYYELSLKDIASWQIPFPSSECVPEIFARVPSMQRGAVWEPQQIEMLWDSMMRGFPIGAIVVSEKIKTQGDKKPETQQEDKTNTEIEHHHILDGQQRTNAIAWGFLDPWESKSSQDAVLWLDLLPDHEKLKKTTRKFLFRVTTKSHPWGFHHGDDAGRLSTSQIRDFFNLHVPISTDEKRPLPKESFPFDANLPIPVSLLFKYFDSQVVDWGMLFLDFEKNYKGTQLTDFKKYKDNFLQNTSAKEDIVRGLKILKQSRVIALQVPSDIDGIENFEQIFQRLNRQGTPLNNEELIYSMIKAYWPEVEKNIQDLNRQVTTEARLIGMAVRVALTEKNAKKIETERSVAQIREIFKPGKLGKLSEHTDIQLYIKENEELKKALLWIDHILIVRGKKDFGMPTYLRSSIAWTSREVFVWLMYLARKFDYKSDLDESLRKKIISIALTIHWFGVDKAKAVDYLVEKTAEGDASASLMDIRIDAIKGYKGPFVLTPLDFSKLNNAIPEIINTDTLEKINSFLKNTNSWNFWNLVVVYEYDAIGVVKKRESEDQEKRKIDYGFFFDKLIHNNELLLYKQRHYIENKFKDFDPSNKVMWKGHNRPWDYDHILPSNNLDSRGSGYETYTQACQAWQGSIGNLIAVDFAFNRSAQHQVSASEKYKGKDKILYGSIDDSSISYFDMTLADTSDGDKSLGFINAARRRLLDIYEDWFDSLDIQKYK